MKSNGTSVEELIRIEAFLLSEKAGHPQGMEDYFWTEASLIVASREKSAPPKRLAAKGKPKAAAAAAPAKKPAAKKTA